MSRPFTSKEVKNMKKILSIFSVVLVLVLCFSACSVNFKEIKSGSIIGIVTPKSEMGDEYNEALRIQEEYGAEQVLIETYDADYAKSASAIAEAAKKLSDNPAVKAIVFARGSTGVSQAMNAVKNARPDIKCICVNFLESEYQISNSADIGIAIDDHAVYHNMVNQAKNSGLKTVVFFVPTHYKNNKSVTESADTLQHVCEETGMGFAYVEIASESTNIEAVKAATKNAVAKYVSANSNEVAFFTTSCIAKDALITSAVEKDAGYIYSYCNCPRNHYQSSFAVADGETYIESIENIKTAAANLLTKKFAYLDVEPAETLTRIAVNYAIAYANGDVDAEGIDSNAIKSACKASVKNTEADDPSFVISEQFNNIVKVGVSVSSF